VGTTTKLHADRLRLYTEQSNAIHAQYLADPELLQQYEFFLDWQVAYTLPFYSEFQTNPDTAAAVEFVISDLIGTGIIARDADLAKVIPIMVRLLPAKALQTLASAMELNARALTINLDICRRLFATTKVEAGICERHYCTAFRYSTSFDECQELIKLVVGLGHSQCTIRRMQRALALCRTFSRRVTRPSMQSRTLTIFWITSRPEWRKSSAGLATRRLRTWIRQPGCHQQQRSSSD